MLTHAEQDAGEEVDDKKDSSYDRRCKIKELLHLSRILYVEEDVEKSIPPIAYKRRKENRHEHREMIHKECAEKLPFIENVAEHIDKNTNESYHHEALELMSRKRVVIVLDLESHENKHENGESEMQKVSDQKIVYAHT